MVLFCILHIIHLYIYLIDSIQYISIQYIINLCCVVFLL